MVSIFGLCQGDPTSRRIHSGSARQCFHALDRAGVLHSAVDAGIGPRLRGILRAVECARSFRIDGTQLLGAWSAASVAARSRRAARLARRAREQGANALLLYGSNAHPSLADESHGLPSGVALDATFAQLARSKEGWFEALSVRDARRCIEQQRRVFERCDIFWPRTQWCAASLQEDYGIPPERIVVASAGGNLDVPPAHRAGHDGRTILFLGRDWERKNGALVLAAFQRARRRRRDLRLLLAGPAEPPEGLPSPGVDYIGPVDNEARLRGLYERCSLFVMPSRFETWGIALVEAQSAGVPVVALDRCAARELVLHGSTGTLLQREDPEELSAAMLHWLDDAPRLAAGGEAALAHVRRRCTWDLAAARMAASLKPLVRG